MASKTLKKKVQAKPAISKLADPVMEPVKGLWFAGLGAVSVVQQEGEKLIDMGGKLFDKLVAEGAKVEKESIELVETTVDDIKSEVETKIDVARQQANEGWDSLGNVFDVRVSDTLERLGIPTTKDLNKLSGRVQQMSRKATNSWKEFEGIFEKRVSDALESLHVPGADDLNKLADSVQKVTREATENLGKLEKVLEKRVSGLISGIESATSAEFKKVNSDLQDVSRQVTDNWGKLEDVVEARVTKVLGGLGLPSNDDISKLSAELKKLSTQVASLEKQVKAGAAVKAKAKPAARKPAVKKPLVPKAETRMTVAEKKKAADAISKMKPASKPVTTS